MGQMKDLLISGSTEREMKVMIDNVRNEHTAGYIQFLEEQLEKAEEKILKMKVIIMQEKGPGYCVECFMHLDKGEIICYKCQDECDGRWDHLRGDNQ